MPVPFGQTELMVFWTKVSRKTCLDKTLLFFGGVFVFPTIFLFGGFVWFFLVEIGGTKKKANGIFEYDFLLFAFFS